jgi:cytochrome c oxidase assembly protein subunit 15
VRLTGSGLGCPDWPTCARRSVTPALSFHPVMEFSNRMVVVVLVVAIAACALATVVAARGRRDLRLLAWSLVGGVVGEAVMGGIVVYTKLNPYVVMGHFMMGIVLLALATVLVLRSRTPGGPGTPKVARAERRLAWALLPLLGLALAAGTATSGAGPDGGSPDAVRLPVPLDDMARTHSLIVMAFGALLLVTLWRLHRAGAPESVQHRGRVLLGVTIAQGLVGYTQFFTHLPVGLVEVHEVGAALVVVAALWFVDGLAHRAGRPLAAAPAGVATAGDRAAARLGTAPVTTPVAQPVP